MEPTPETANDAAEASSKKSREYGKTAGFLTTGVGKLRPVHRHLLLHRGA
ncbi:MAG: hypothetical protein IPK93_13370 [Solirubrobacterales bacterium]|nr:hypothetical protein [Solirubrobacterales bacterium]